MYQRYDDTSKLVAMCLFAALLLCSGIMAVTVGIEWVPFALAVPVIILVLRPMEELSRITILALLVFAILMSGFTIWYNSGPRTRVDVKIVQKQTAVMCLTYWQTTIVSSTGKLDKWCGDWGPVGSTAAGYETARGIFRTEK